MPFANISDKVRIRLEDAEKTLGGPKGILAKVTKIAHESYVQKASDIFKDDGTDQASDVEQDGSGEGGSHDLLECVRRMMILDARIQESSKKKSRPGKNQKKTVLKESTLSNIPPGGVLGISSVPGESPPTMAGLSIDRYSNAIYWQFKPYLEPVRCGPRSRMCCLPCCRNSVLHLKSYTNPTIEVSTVLRSMTLSVFVQPRRGESSRMC